MPATDKLAHARLYDLDSLTEDPRNARTHAEPQLAQLEASMRRFGWTNPVLVEAERDNLIRAGHGRVTVARRIWEAGGDIALPSGKLLPRGKVPGFDVSGWSEDDSRAYALADNQLALQAGWDDALLKEELDAIAGLGIDLGDLGFDADAMAALESRLLEEVRDGGKAMRGKGVSGSQRLAVGDGDLVRRMTDGEGRKPGLGGVTMDALSSHPRYYEQKTAAEARLGRELSNEEFERDHWVLPDSQLSSGTSIFDPVLCEIAYRWWCPPAGLVLDPFAGGSVRGIVAAALGRRYLGVDLREEQIIANRVQWDEIGPRLVDLVEGQPERPAPEWLVGDSLTALDDQPPADFIFSCPPYGDLEVYSDVPGDLSTLDAAEFDRLYHEIVGKAVARLADNRFACFVVGDYREKGPGFYRRFVAKTEAAFEDAGARLYNECILITSAGSLAIRAGKQFRATRKVGKAHQNVLVFCKGDPRKATEACGAVDVSEALRAFAEAQQLEPTMDDDEPLQIAAE